LKLVLRLDGVKDYIAGLKEAHTSIWHNTLASIGKLPDMVRMIRSSLSDDPNAWEWAISRFEAEDLRQPPPAGAIVFTGSSSITLWDTLRQDMAPLRVLNRGFGGSKIDQVAQYAPRTVVPYNPAAVVLFAGTNDITGRKPKTAQQVCAGYRAFVETVRRALPETVIYYISITPTPARWQHWSEVCEANEQIRTATFSGHDLHYIDLTPGILGPDGEPRRELYRSDRLHPNQKGYAVWSAIIKPVLLADLSEHQGCCTGLSTDRHPVRVAGDQMARH
jgi:lysophospholipase L1-like esterase